MRFWLVTCILLLASTNTIWAHGGGLDAYGCHFDRKRGLYHCHCGPFADRSFVDKSEMLRERKMHQSKLQQKNNANNTLSTSPSNQAN